MVPETPVAPGEQPLLKLSRSMDPSLDVEFPVVLLADASLASARLARLAWTPVPAAKPTTAADRKAMIRLRTKTITEQPQIRFSGRRPKTDASVRDPP